MITQEKLRELLSYDQDTGNFYWLNPTCNRIKRGDVAGTLDDSGAVKYIRIGLLGKMYRAHRLAFLYITGEFPADEVDHADGNGLNNKWSNIEKCDHTGNMKNTKVQRNNKLGILGVCYDTGRTRFIAHIGAKGKVLRIGRFVEIWDAICARKSAEREYNYHVNTGRVSVRG